MKYIQYTASTIFELLTFCAVIAIPVYGAIFIAAMIGKLIDMGVWYVLGFVAMATILIMRHMYKNL